MKIISSRWKWNLMFYSATDGASATYRNYTYLASCRLCDSLTIIVRERFLSSKFKKSPTKYIDLLQPKVKPSFTFGENWSVCNINVICVYFELICKWSILFFFCSLLLSALFLFPGSYFFYIHVPLVDV